MAAWPGLRASDAAASRSAIGPRRPARPSARSVGSEQARGRDGGREDDQRGHEQQERARPVASRQLLRVDRSARPADEHDRERAERGDVERRDRRACRVAARARGPLRRGAASLRARRRAPRGSRRARAARGRSTSPAGEPARAAITAAAPPPTTQPAIVPDGGQRERLGERVQLDLPPAGAEPRQPPARVVDVATQRGGGEDREREQQRAALAAEQQQPACRGRRRVGRGRERRRSERSPGTRPSSPRSRPSGAAPCARNASTVHGWTSPLADRARTRRTSGRTSRARCCRESPATPFAITIGDGCGVWYRTARATSRSAERAGRTGRTACRASAPRGRPRSAAGACVDGIGPLPFEPQHLAVRREARLRQPARDERAPSGRGRRRRAG